jgi:hypothetical protein
MFDRRSPFAIVVIEPACLNSGEQSGHMIQAMPHVSAKAAGHDADGFLNVLRVSQWLDDAAQFAKQSGEGLRW